MGWKCNISKRGNVLTRISLRVSKDKKLEVRGNEL